MSINSKRRRDAKKRKTTRKSNTPETATERMKRKIDSPQGKRICSKRLGTVEPVFGHLRHTMKLDRFSLRGKLKVDCQWLLFCALHNLKKIHRFVSGRYGEAEPLS